MSRVPQGPIPIEGGAQAARERLTTRPVTVPASILDRVREQGGAVDLGIAETAEAGRDWWPVAIGWAAQGAVPSRPAAVVRPSSAAQVAELLAACADDRVPVTAAGGRSGVCGAAVPVFGGVALDCTGLVGEVVVDETSCIAEVPAGVFGEDLEGALRAQGAGYTLGHWPQSMALSTVGGWLACRSAGQYSTRYGKVEDMVAGLEVVLADGTIVRTAPAAPRAATGPDLTQLFVGSEGVLGVITRAWLRVHPVPAAQGRRAFGFSSLHDGIDACRRVLRRGATPAVLRLYDQAESARAFSEEDRCVLVVLDEADPSILDATLGIVDEECRGAERLDEGLVAHWLATRNDVSALAPLWRAGVVVDTAEVAARWQGLDDLAGAVPDALRAVQGTIAVSVHLSHAYLDGACLYFTFAGSRPEGSAEPEDPNGGHQHAPAWTDRYYRRAWDALSAVVTERGGALSHHHGIGLNRARFLPDAMGPAHGVLVALKRALDPTGILNPGKLAIPSPFGEPPWP